MRFDEEIAGPCQQHAEPPGALVGVQEQSADLARAFEVRRQRQRLVAKGAAELGALLRQRRNEIAVERIFGAHCPEHLASPDNLLVRYLLEHEDVEVVSRRIAVSLK